MAKSHPFGPTCAHLVCARYFGHPGRAAPPVAEVDSWSDAYARIGRGRLADGTGESVAVYYLKERFEHLQSGHFWLSDTPDVPGSATFGNKIPRMVTWVRLREREAENGFASTPTSIMRASLHAGKAADDRRLYRQRAGRLPGRGDGRL